MKGRAISGRGFREILGGQREVGVVVTGPDSVVVGGDLLVTLHLRCFTKGCWYGTGTGLGKRQNVSGEGFCV